MDLLRFFGFSFFYNLAYLFISTKVSETTFYIVFMVMISLLYSIFLYQWLCGIWKNKHKVDWKEGFCVMGLQLFLMLVVSVVFRYLNTMIDNTILFQGICAIFFFLWTPFSYSFYYRFQCHQLRTKKFDFVILIFGVVLMALVVGGDTLFQSVFSFGNFYGSCTSLAYAANPWFGWTMSISVGLIFQQAFGKMLVSSFLFLVLGFVYALAMKGYALLIQKRGIQHGIK